MFKRLIIFCIKIYKKTEGFRIALYSSMGISHQACRHSPTCSDYTIQAIQEYGTISGILRGGKRLLSCHPFSPVDS